NLLDLLWKYKEVFIAPNKIPTTTPLVSHAIQSEGVAYTKPYRIPPAHQEKAEEMVDELLKQGVIEESSSEFNAPIVLVQKKTGDLRMCLDLRSLNQITKKAKFPLPTTREMFDQLAGSWYFSSMDMLWAYWSIPLRETDRHKTAFTLRNKKYCWKVMCFGLTN
ncbi:unnamed protein product, partial [Heterosigma akashiwo]